MIKKRTKREESSIIVGNFFSLVMIIAIVLVFFSFLQPKIDEIEELKQKAKEASQKIEDLNKKGISLADLKNFGNIGNNKNDEQNGADNKKDDKKASILKEIDENFYKKNFTNSDNQDYEQFLKKKEEELKKYSNQEDKSKIISKILPYYSEEIVDLETLTDFEFINYIELIMQKFRLNYNNSIGIKEIKQIDNFSLTEKDNSLETGISKIPLELNILNGEKSNILDFLNFIENVGKISLDKEENIIIYKENSGQNDIFKDYKKLTLNGKKASVNYNIFNNQIIDVEEIFIEDYLDSGGDIVTGGRKILEFISDIKSKQSKEKINLKIKLNFYVKGVPKYKIDEFGKKFNAKLDSLLKDLNEILRKTDVSSSEKQKMTSLKQNLENIKKSTNSNLKQQSLTDKYKIISSYTSILNNYEEQIKKVKK